LTNFATVITPLNGLEYPLGSLWVIDQRVPQGSMHKLEMLSFRPSEDGFFGRHCGFLLVDQENIASKRSIGDVEI